MRMRVAVCPCASESYTLLVCQWSLFCFCVLFLIFVCMFVCFLQNEDQSLLVIVKCFVREILKNHGRCALKDLESSRVPRPSLIELKVFF